MSAHVVGLTGQSGAGKTTVGREFVRNGFYHIDCDRLAHQLLGPGTKCTNALMKQFPQFYTGGIFDRRKAAPLLFSDKALLESYNSAIFPFITDEIQVRIAECEKNGNELILLDAPTLFEAGADRMCELIVACVADESIRLERIMLRDKIDGQSARNRFKSQHSEDFFREHADYVIENNGDYSDTLIRSKMLSDEIRKRLTGD